MKKISLRNTETHTQPENGYESFRINNMHEKQEKLETIVRRVLSEDINTRNSDQLLTLKVWYEISPSSFCQILSEWYVSVEAIKTHLPQENSVKRVRAKIQNDHQELKPTDEAVLLKRSKSKKNQETLSQWESKNLE